MIATADLGQLMSSPRSRLIAFYLPQYHPIPENDTWWGKGFTEWANVSRAHPLFPGHNQPRQPAELGFYDLRVPEVREAQAELARQHGIHGFCYYYYWFEDGKRLLERPLEEMLASGKPDFPFCLCWANENWTRRWDGQERQILMRQDHSPENDMAFLHSVLPYMRDPRYIRVDGRPLLMIYRSTLFPNIAATVSRWREELKRLGEPDIYLVAAETFDVSGDAFTTAGFDALCEFPPHQAGSETLVDSRRIQFNEPFSGRLHDYTRIVDRFLSRPAVRYRRIRTVMLEWDNTARRKASSHVMVNYSLTSYHRWLRGVIDETSRLENPDERLVFINAWNEWAEGTYLEPDTRNGLAPLEATLAAQEDRDWEPTVALAATTPAASSTSISPPPPESAIVSGATPLLQVANYEPRLHLISLTMMGNEADIAESFVRANLRFVDQMYIVLNNAHDGTADIIQALHDEGLPITISWSTSSRFDQLQTINRLAREVLSEQMPDWLIPLDADEIINARDRRVLEEALLANGPRHARVPWVQHVATAFDDVDEANPLLRLKQRYDYEAPTPDLNPWVWKTFVNVALFAPYLDRYQIGRGAHRIELQSMNEESKQPSRPLAGICLQHYPARSHEHLLLKGGLGWIQLCLAEGSSPEHTKQWGDFSKLCDKKEATTTEDLQYAARVYLDFNRISAEVLRDTPIIPDPCHIDFRTCYDALRRPPASALLPGLREQLLGSGQTKPTFGEAGTASSADPARTHSFHSPHLWESLTQVESGSMTAYYHDKPRTELLPLIGNPGKRLLDIGCGAGATSQELRKRFPHCHVTGLELNRHAAQVATERLDLVIQENIEAMSLPDARLPDGGFDTILFADVLEHLVNPWQILLRVRSLLKPGGRLIASIPNVFNLRLLNDLAQGDWHYAKDGLLDITHLRFFTAETMQKMLEETGYRVLAVEGLRQNTPELPAYVRDGLATISTEFLTLHKQSPDQIDQLFNLQHVIVVTPA